MTNKGKKYKIDKSKNKNKAFLMRMTEEEYYILLYLAKEYGLSLNRYIRIFTAKAVSAFSEELRQKGQTYEDIKNIFYD